MIKLHPDFKDFLKLLNFYNVQYLLLGGYAVGYYGYPRATADMDIWIAVNDDNAAKIVKALCDFGMPEQEVTKSIFLQKNKIIRMGLPPVRIEIITGASGIDFDKCYPKREEVVIEDIPVKFISLDDIKVNKKASGRHKDLEDLKHLP